MFNQKLFQITNIFALLNKKAEIHNFVILLLKVGHHFNIDWNWIEEFSLKRGGCAQPDNMWLDVMIYTMLRH